MPTKRIFTLAAIVAGSLMVQSTNAQTFIAERQAGEGTYLGYTRLDGSFDDEYHPSSVSAEIELDADARTVVFRRVTFEIPIEGKNFASGFGESVFIEGKITFEFTDDKALKLTSEEGNQFLVNDWNIDGIRGDRYSMTYELWGPTESIEGTFAFSIDSLRRISLTGKVPIIDTTGYPDKVVVRNNPSWVNGRDSQSNQVSETIDGADISFRFDVGNIRFSESLTFSLKTEPEPEPSEISGVRFGLFDESGVIIIGGTGTIGVSDSPSGPFEGEIALPAIVTPDDSARFFKAN